MKWLLMIIIVGITILLRFSPPAFTFDAGAEMVITLGLAVLIGEIFSESFGPFLKTVIVSVIVINQIIGPVIFRIGLQKAGEIGKKT